MQHSTSRQLYAYWSTLLGNQLAPRRAEFEPSRLAGILGSTFLLETVPAGTFRFRLAGTHCCSQLGFDPDRGDFLSLWARADRETIAAILKAVTQGACVLVDAASSGPRLHDWDDDSDASRLELLLLPLVHTGSAIDRIIGSAAIIAGGVPDEGTSRPFRLLRHALAARDPNQAECLDSTDLPVDRHPPVRRARVVTAHGRRFRVYRGGLDPM